MGPTNSVQPYCRLAIITMQMMPKTSWLQRVASDAGGRRVVSLLFVDMVTPVKAEKAAPAYHPGQRRVEQKIAGRTTVRADDPPPGIRTRRGDAGGVHCRPAHRGAAVGPRGWLRSGGRLRRGGRDRAHAPRRRA